MRIFIFFLVITFSLLANSFPIPKNNKATFDIIRKNKIIGSAETLFLKKNQNLTVTTIIDIDIKILFIPAYKFYQEYTETWKDGEFIKFKGYTDFEDEREYFINGEDIDENFIAFGMDGDLILNKDILPLNYWNKEILNKKILFDTQKGITREIKVKKLQNEIIKINNYEIATEKYLLDASSNPKDKGPFPQYTLWYDQNNELVKFKFKNYKDNHEVITIRNNWGN